MELGLNRRERSQPRRGAVNFSTVWRTVPWRTMSWTTTSAPHSSTIKQSRGRSYIWLSNSRLLGVENVININLIYRNVLEFWSTVGERQFPNLARLARFIIATPASPAQQELPLPSTPLGDSDLMTLLILRYHFFYSFMFQIDESFENNFRPEVLNSLNRSRACIVAEARALPSGL